MVVIASLVSAKPSSLKRPRARDIASSTLLRRIMRPPSNSTFRMVPLLRPSASRTALGRVIWPRSATVASIGFLRRAEVWMKFTYFKNHTQSVILCRFPAPSGQPARVFRPQLQEFSPHERFLRHSRPPRRQRQVLHLRQPAQARRKVRHRPPALFDEDPAGEPAAPRGRRRHGRQGPHRGRG